MTIDDARERLIRLQAERLDAAQAGVPQASDYMRRLNAAIADAHAQYTCTAVIEIAALRRELGRPLAA
jgi:hypothetical protein